MTHDFILMAQFATAGLRPGSILVAILAVVYVVSPFLALVSDRRLSVPYPTKRAAFLTLGIIVWILNVAVPGEW